MATGSCDLCTERGTLVTMVFRASGQEDALLDVCLPCARDYLDGLEFQPNA